MTRPSPPTPQIPTIGVTVFDSATVFDGLSASDVVYRYDLPAEGIAQGWATHAVVDQIRALAAEHWPDVDVLIDASDDITDVITRVLASKGVSARAASAAEEHIPVGDDSSHTVVLPNIDEHWSLGRPTEPRRAALRRFIVLFAVLVVVGVLSCTALLLFFHQDSEQNDLDEREGATATEQSKTEDADSVATTPPISQFDTATFGEYSVELPHGFQLRWDEKRRVVLGEGEDPDLRIYLIADPLYGVPGATVLQEIERMVEHDPQLDSATKNGERLEYLESPGDDSLVRWTTWIDQERQINIGCHFRRNPKPAQQAACTKAVETLHVNPLISPGTESVSTES